MMPVFMQQFKTPEGYSQYGGEYVPGLQRKKHNNG